MNREELAERLSGAFRAMRGEDSFDAAWTRVADAAIEAMKPPTIDDERRKLWRDTLSRTLAACYVIDGVDSQEAWKRAYQAANAALAADAEKWGAK